MDKTFTIVGISTQGKITKFRVANGDLAARVKVLERGGHTDIKLVELDRPMSKNDAIAAYKTMNPEAVDVRVPNEKPAGTKVSKTVTISNASNKKVTDAASDLIDTVEG
jgi:hypothetical protein